jgi:preprotein translocase SecE subunit
MQTMWIKLGVLAALVVPMALYLFVKREPLRRFIGEVKFEMEKVTWPGRDEVQNSTVLVLFVTVLLSLMCFVFDWIFVNLFGVIY